MGRELARVGVEVDDEVPAGHGERPPHGVALAERLPELREQLRLLVDVGPQPDGDLGRPVLRGGVHHEDLIDQVAERLEPLDDLPDRVGHLSRGQRDRDRLPLAF